MQQTKGINSYENIVLLVYVRTGKEYGIFLKWDLIAWVPTYNPGDNEIEAILTIPPIVHKPVGIDF